MLSWDSDEELECKCLLLGMQLFTWARPPEESQYMIIDLEGYWMFTKDHRHFYKTKREALKGALTMFFDGTPRTKDAM